MHARDLGLCRGSGLHFELAAFSQFLNKAQRADLNLISICCDIFPFHVRFISIPVHRVMCGVHFNGDMLVLQPCHGPFISMHMAAYWAPLWWKYSSALALAYELCRTMDFPICGRYRITRRSILGFGFYSKGVVPQPANLHAISPV